MHAPGAGCQRGHDVRAQRIADHHGVGWACTMPGKEPGIGLGGLVRDDLDRAEIVAERRRRDLALLVDEIALGDDDELVRLCQGAERRLDMRQRFDRVAQHLPPCIDQLADHGSRHAPFGDLDRRLDHRQGEALHSEAVMLDVAPLGRRQVFAQMVRVGIGPQQFFEPRRGQLKEALVMPERVVGIKADDGEIRHLPAPRGPSWSTARSRSSIVRRRQRCRDRAGCGPGWHSRRG